MSFPSCSCSHRRWRADRQSETTAPTTIRSFGPIPGSVTESSVSGTSDGERETSEIATESGTTETETDGTRTATEGSVSDDWEDQ